MTAAAPERLAGWFIPSRVPGPHETDTSPVPPGTDERRRVPHYDLPDRHVDHFVPCVAPVRVYRTHDMPSGRLFTVARCDGSAADIYWHPDIGWQDDTTALRCLGPAQPLAPPEPTHPVQLDLF